MNTSGTIHEYASAIIDYTKQHYKKCFREPAGNLKYRYIVPGSGYGDQLWDWDSWLADLSIGILAKDDGISEYETGCILNFLRFVDENGWTPIFIQPEKTSEVLLGGKKTNSHKPCLAQHALFVSRNNGNDASWLEEYFPKLELYLDYYENNCKHESGLYFWIDDFAIGVDNDPCTFYRPERSSASIFLNCFMYKEFLAMVGLSEMLCKKAEAEKYKAKANELYNAVQNECWDERDGFFYNVDINLTPINPDEWLHKGAPRHWTGLIQRIGVWSGFLAMWAGIATKEQAERMVKEHYLDEKTFYAPYGVRSLSKMEKMYTVKASGNPSCWLGPIWGIVNYVVFEGLKDYGYINEAKELCRKTITLFGRDIIDNGAMHEYYDPETGEGVMNLGFQNWNLLSINMYNWLCENDK